MTAGDRIHLTGKTLKIVLTGRRPVIIDVDAWPVVARGLYVSQDNEPNEYNRKTEVDIKVRQHVDGRSIVYGTYDYDTRWQHEDCARYRAGVIVGSDDAATCDGLVNAVLETAENLISRGGDDTAVGAAANDCIRDLPAETLT